MTVHLTGDWERMIKALDPAVFRANLAREVEMAHARIGADFRARAVRAIRAQHYAPNSPITIAIKGSSTPLVRGGDLIQSITSARPKWDELRLGIMRGAMGAEFVNVARILHEGAVIDTRLHPEVRAAVMARVAAGARAKRRGASKRATQAAVDALSSRTGSGLWVIPPRPFLAAPFLDPRFRAVVRAEWGLAVRRAFGAPR